MTTGENIRRFRKEKGLKQSDLAEKTGISVTSIGYYERDVENRKPGTGQIEKIATALEVSPVDIIGWEYFDQTIDTERLANNVEKIRSFEGYLSNLGYSVESSPDGELFIIKDGIVAEFNENEFDELQAKYIELRKKVEELQEDNQAIIEARIRKKAK